jgi:hypothetical protein
LKFALGGRIIFPLVSKKAPELVQESQRDGIRKMFYNKLRPPDCLLSF